MSAAQQHPFFDVFKTLKIQDWQNASKEGDVKVTYDKAAGKNTVVIGGATPASNYVAIPTAKNGQTPSLGLTGKFVGEPPFFWRHQASSSFLSRQFADSYEPCRYTCFCAHRRTRTSSCTSISWSTIRVCADFQHRPSTASCRCRTGRASSYRLVAQSRPTSGPCCR